MSENFESDVNSITPYRKRLLSLSIEERKKESSVILSNTNIKIEMKQDHSDSNDYWDAVIAEADKRITLSEKATALTRE
tara:strand:+ start:155 stop:391 length:237 start_codon:yes stop_codon:yes gene_type:complete